MQKLRHSLPKCVGGGVERSPRQGFQGFTLAEVLITLGIIGVVAAMTIPTLVADYQTKSYNTAATVFERKLGEALKVMNSQSSLAGFSSTEDFIDELSKHFKINKVCQNDELMDCFEEEVLWGSGTATPEAVDMSVVKTTKNFGQKDWQETNVVGVQFASGVTALIAYNTNASQDPYSNQIVSLSGSSNGKSGSVSLGTDALAILYDTNGFKAPNQSAKDLRSINVTKLGKGCFAEVNGLCITMQPQVPTPVTKAECEELKVEGYGIVACIEDTDYWAGAVKLCGGTNKMANMADLGKIAAYIYNKENIGAEENIESLNFDRTKASELGLPSSSNFSLWSNRESSRYNNSDYRYFASSYTHWNNNPRNGYESKVLAVCIE